jgi:hypothetical protein
MTTLEINAMMLLKNEAKRRLSRLKESNLICEETRPEFVFQWFDAALESAFEHITLRGGEYDNSRESMSVADSQGKVEQEPMRPMQAKRPVRLPCP